MNMNMINELNKLLKCNYKLIEVKDGLKIYNTKNGFADPEIYIIYRKNSSEHEVLECHRGTEFKIGTFTNEKHAICAIYLYFKRTFNHSRGNNTLIDELWNYKKEEGVHGASEIIQRRCESKYFSLDKPKRNAICMENINELYNIFYIGESGKKINIVDGTSFNRAIVVTYNFALIIIEFEELYAELKQHELINEDDFERMCIFYLKH